MLKFRLVVSVLVVLVGAAFAPGAPRAPIAAEGGPAGGLPDQPQMSPGAVSKWAEDETFGDGPLSGGQVQELRDLLRNAARTERTLDALRAQIRGLKNVLRQNKEVGQAWMHDRRDPGAGPDQEAQLVTRKDLIQAAEESETAFTAIVQELIGQDRSIKTDTALLTAQADVLIRAIGEVLLIFRMIAVIIFASLIIKIIFFF